MEGGSGVYEAGCDRRSLATSPMSPRMRAVMPRMTSEDILALLEAEDDGLVARPIGIWTLEKLATLLLYFRAFTNACVSVGGGFYVDGFAGSGLCRVKNAQIGSYHSWGSPSLALRTEPNFERAILLDIDAKNVETLRLRTQAYGTRVACHRGDANTDLANLIEQYVPPGAPCFCLLDPAGTELAWTTLEAIASIPRTSRKPELLVLFPLRMAILRLLTTRADVSPSMITKIDRLFGGHAWYSTYEARILEEISPVAAQAEYLRLYEDGLRELGYEWVRSKPVLAPRAAYQKRQEMYHLVFATDHPAGDEIMQDVFSRPYFLDFPISRQKPLFE